MERMVRENQRMSSQILIDMAYAIDELNNEVKQLREDLYNAVIANTTPLSKENDNDRTNSNPNTGAL